MAQTNKAQTDTDKEYKKIMEQCKKEQAAKERKWNRMSIRDLELELHEMLFKDDDLMDQENLFDAQNISITLLKRKKVVDKKGTVLRPAFDVYSDKPIKAPEKINFDNMSDWLLEEFTTDSDLTKSLSILYDQYNDLNEEGRKIMNMTLVSVLGYQIHTMAVRTARK